MTLEDLIEQARYRVVNGLVSDEEWRENTISFAYGNVRLRVGASQ